MNTASINTINSLPRYNKINHKDRFSLMMFFALAFHAVVILGISFDALDEETLYKSLTLDVTLVSSKTDEEVEDAAYSAQENQLGGGNTQEKLQPSSPFSNETPNKDNDISPNTRQEFAPPKQEKVDRKLAMITVENRRARLSQQKSVDPLPIESKKDKPSIKLLNSSEISDLTNRLKKQMLSHTEKIEEMRRGQRARKYKNAFYDVDWQNKIERIGSINYPTAVLKNKLTGNVLIDVQIKADGSVFNIVVIKSSGFKILDNAAIKIVNLAAPFPPLTAEILLETQIYHVIRKWHFKSGKALFK